MMAHQFTDARDHREANLLIYWRAVESQCVLLKRKMPDLGLIAEAWRHEIQPAALANVMPPALQD